MLAVRFPDDRPLTLSGSEGMTNAELEAFCLENPGLRIERVPDGQLLLMPLTHTDSGRSKPRPGGRLYPWFERNATLVLRQATWPYKFVLARSSLS